MTRLYSKHFTLPREFFRRQPELGSLTLCNYTIVLNGPFQRLHSAWLDALDLSGCDLTIREGEFLAPVVERGHKPFEGLQKVGELRLERFAPFTGGWNGMQDGLCDLGITSMTSLRYLNLSCNRLTQIPAHLSALKRLMWLDLSKNFIHFAQETVMDLAILALPWLRILNLSGCMTARLVNAHRAHLHHMDKPECAQRSAATDEAQALAAAPCGMPDLHQLITACPRLNCLYFDHSVSCSAV